MAIRLEVISVGFEPNPDPSVRSVGPAVDPFYACKFLVIRDGEFEGFSFSNMELFVNVPKSVGGVDSALLEAHRQIADFAEKLAAEARK